MKKSSIFNTIATARVGSNTFDLSYDNKLTFKIGELVPTCLIETIPGDKVNINVENLLRFKPLTSPVMGRFQVRTDFFALGNHVQYPDFDKFITGKTTPAHPIVIVPTGNAVEGSIADYLGYHGAGSAQTQTLNAFPLAMYYKIYDDWYRADKIETTELWTELTAGTNAWLAAKVTETPLKASYNHDYFQACLPTAAGTDVSIPLIDSTTVDVEHKGGAQNPAIVKSAATGNAVGGATVDAEGGTGFLEVSTTNTNLDPNGSLEVDINAAAATIRTLRRAFKLQEFLEAANRGGDRITEWLSTIWGVASSDTRHDRVEFIGRNVQPMIISEVLSTAEGTSTEVGSYAGHGISVGGSNNFSHYCEDHGFIMGITSIIPEANYYQGIHKSLFKSDYLDYPIPHFANIGEEEVYNKEIYSNQSVTLGDGVFGYIPRYSSYKFKNNEVHGEFKSTLSHFTPARTFGSAPSLNTTFLRVDADNHKHIFADQTGDHIIAHVFNNIKVNRKLPKFNAPSL